MITPDEALDWKKIVNENKGLLMDANTNIKSKILDALNDKKKQIIAESKFVAIPIPESLRLASFF